MERQLEIQAQDEIYERLSKGVPAQGPRTRAPQDGALDGSETVAHLTLSHDERVCVSGNHPSC